MAPGEDDSYSAKVRRKLCCSMDNYIEKSRKGHIRIKETRDELGWSINKTRDHYAGIQLSWATVLLGLRNTGD